MYENEYDEFEEYDDTELDGDICIVNIVTNKDIDTLTFKSDVQEPAVYKYCHIQKLNIHASVVNVLTQFIDCIIDEVKIIHSNWAFINRMFSGCKIKDLKVKYVELCFDLYHEDIEKAGLYENEHWYIAPENRIYKLDNKEIPDGADNKYYEESTFWQFGYCTIDNVTLINDTILSSKSNVGFGRSPAWYNELRGAYFYECDINNLVYTVSKEKREQIKPIREYLDEGIINSGGLLSIRTLLGFCTCTIYNPVKLSIIKNWAFGFNECGLSTMVTKENINKVIEVLKEVYSDVYLIAQDNLDETYPILYSGYYCDVSHFIEDCYAGNDLSLIIEDSILLESLVRSLVAENLKITPPLLGEAGCNIHILLNITEDELGKQSIDALGEKLWETHSLCAVMGMEKQLFNVFNLLRLSINEQPIDEALRTSDGPMVRFIDTCNNYTRGINESEDEWFDEY